MRIKHTTKRAWIVAFAAMALVLLFVLTAFAETGGGVVPADEIAATDLISYQVTKSEDGKFALRLIAGVDALEAYRTCGYRVRVTTKNETGNNVTTTVSGRTPDVYSSFFGGETEYLVSEISAYTYAYFATLKNLDVDSDYIRLEIAPMLVTLENETLYGETFVFLYEGELDEEGYPTLTSSRKADEEEPEFKTVLRFVATSDVHIKAATGTQSGRLETIMTQLNEYFALEANNEGHAGVDALVVAGDVTNQIESKPPTMPFEELAKQELATAKAYFDNLLSGTDTELVITMGNHDWNAFNDPDTYNNTVAVELFEEYFGEGSTTGMVKIGGYWFITLNNDTISAFPNQAFRGMGWGYTDARVAEYERMIEAAIADTGTDKPIFVVRHTGDVGTVLGTDEVIAYKSATSVENLEALQSKYPNLVVFSGHSHFPLYDDYSIHQRDFTSINTGTLGSSSVSRLEGKAVSEHANATLLSSGNATAVWLLEVDELGRTRVRRWDAVKNGFVGETYLLKSYNKDEFVYTEDRFDASDLFFAENAKISTYDVFDTTASISFLPVPAESLMARAYEVVLRDAAGNAVTTHYLCPEYYLGKYDVPMQYSFEDLTPGATYTVTVTAINPKDSVELDHKDALRSEPLTVTFTTAATGGVTTGADLIDIVIYPEIGLVGRKNAQNLPAGIFGKPEYAYDETINMNVVSLDGAAKNYLRFECMSLSETLVDGFTLEAVVRLDEAPTADAGVVSGTQSGGYGIWAYKNGTMSFTINDNTTAHKIKICDYVVGTYYHIVASFDGSVCTVYLNGEAVGSATLDENGLKLPATEKYRNLAVGADIYTGTGVHYPSKCTVGVVRLYSDVLTAETVKSNYEALNLPEVEEPEVPEIKLLDLAIDASKGTAVDVAGQGIVQTTRGEPSIVYDEKIGRDVISVDAAGGNFVHFTLKQVTDRLVDGGFTFETLVRVDEMPTSTAAGLVSGLHGGGFGLFAKTNGKLEFQIYDDGSVIKKEIGSYTVGTYYHVVAVQSGTACTVYVDGEVAVSFDMTRFHYHASTPGYDNIMIGGDTYIARIDGFTNPSKCTVGVLNIHSAALTAEEVSAAYEAATANAPKYLLNLKIDAASQSAVDVAGKGAVQTLLGSPVISYDETIGRSVVSTNGSETSVLHYTLNPILDSIVDGFSFETLVRVDEMPTARAVLVGATQNGGFTLVAELDGTLTFGIYDNGKLEYIYNIGNYTVGTYYHVVATYDDVNKICTVYVNGKSAGTVENMTSFHLHTSKAGYRNLVVGGDTYLTQKLTDPSKCTVGILRIYDNALTEAEVTAAYGAAIKK